MILPFLSHRSAFLAGSALLFLLLHPTAGYGEDWLQFRGTNAAGVYAGNIPTQWDDDQNLKWAIPLPGKGVSSPIVVGDRVFVTTFSGFGQDVNKPGELANLRRNLVCVNRGTGEILWQRSPPTRFPEDKFEGFVTDHGYASCTPVSDGERVYAFFGKSGIYAFDLDGKVLWQKFVGNESGPTEWGSGTSPVIYKELLLVNACDETQALIAFDRVKGDEIWRVEAKLYEGSYSTPVIGKAADGSDEIIIPLADEIWGIDPTTGKLKWWVTESLGKYICTTPVVGDGVVYVAASSKVIAIRLGGQGDVGQSHTVWSRNAGPGVPSPVFDQGKLYWVGTNGILTCADAATGKTLWRERMGGAERNITYASLTKANNIWLSMTQQGGTIAFRLKPEFEEVSTNRFAGDTTPFKSSFAAANGELFVRSDTLLYCIAEGGTADLAKVEKNAPKSSVTDAFASRIPGSFFQGRSGNSVGPAQLLTTLDVNNDDKISAEELAESPMPKFVQAMMMARGDKNKDGFIDAEERVELQASTTTKPGEVIGRKNASNRPTRPGGSVVPAGSGAQGAPNGQGGPVGNGGFGGFGGPGGRGGPNRETIKVFKKFDLNNDGWLNTTEREPARSYAKEQKSQMGGGGFGPPGFGPSPDQTGARPSTGPGSGGFGGRGRGPRPLNLPPAKPGKKVNISDVAPASGDLYDPAILRTIFIDFEEEDWETVLSDFRDTDVDVAAKMTVDGKEYPIVGIRFRGNTSYRIVPAGYKRPLNIAMDSANEDQRLYGYKTLNLHNGVNDPTHLSASLYSHIASQHMPVPKVNFVKLVINGESWGIYSNVQQLNKEFLKEHYDSSKGARWKVPGSPQSRGGMQYFGDDLAAYEKFYEAKDASPESWRKLIGLCKLLNETPTEKLAETIRPLINIDELLWFLAVDIATVNSDGYWTRGSDYYIWLDDKSTFHFYPYDMNEAFLAGHGPGPGAPGGPGGFGPPGGFGFGPGPSAGPDLDPLDGLDNERFPLRSRILAVPEFRKQYLLNIQTLGEKTMTWDSIAPIVSQYRKLIETELKDDTRKLNSYEDFIKTTSAMAESAASDDGKASSRETLKQFFEVRSERLRKAAEN